MRRKHKKKLSIKSKNEKVKILESENLNKNKIDEIEKKETLKYGQYRKRKVLKKITMTNTERQKSFELKQKKEGLKKTAFWLTKEDLKVIDREQKKYESIYNMKLNKSKTLSHILRRFSNRK
jgi:hypothetical protein